MTVNVDLGIGAILFTDKASVKCSKNKGMIGKHQLKTTDRYFMKKRLNQNYLSYFNDIVLIDFV